MIGVDLCFYVHATEDMKAAKSKTPETADTSEYAEEPHFKNNLFMFNRVLIYLVA